MRQRYLAYLQATGFSQDCLTYERSSRLLINHSLLPLSRLPRKRAGEKIRKEAIFSQDVERDGDAATEDRAFFNTLLDHSVEATAP